MAILSTTWDFGDGSPVSSDYAPLNQYPPGQYTVILTAVVQDDDTGVITTYKVTKPLYIRVEESDQSLLTEDYLKNPKCLHYDWDRGWSEYGGEHWIWPATPASVAQYESDGEIYTLAWDIKDNKRYILNTRDTYNGEAVYKDKDIHPIATSITLPEYTGELQKYDVSHLETYLRFRPELLEDTLDVDFEVDVALITDDKEEPVELAKNVDTSREITFFYQNEQSGHTQTRQLRVDTSESMYQLINYESFFKINNRFRTPSYGVSDNAQEFFAEALFWYTKGDYTLNRATGTPLDTTTYKEIEGVDGDDTSGAKLTSSLVIPNNQIVNGALTLWYKGTLTIPDVTLTDYDSVGNWKFAYCNDTLPTSITIPDTSEIFDVRVMDTLDNAITPEIFDTYLDHYFRQYNYYLPD